MVTPERIKRISRKYQLTSLWITFGLLILGLLMVQGFRQYALVSGLLFSAAYSLITCFAYGKAWVAVARRSPNVLSRFYMAASVLRMLLALAVVLVAAVVMRNDTMQMLSFIGVFAVFYLVLLVFDSIFFARVEKTKE
ncbi:MAG: hypothetical protein MR450_02870 [Prevotella sp.]|nr:hypothetical protein [Prevotella sp.]MDY4039732.1 hypothetical protein [Prevotella sp.]